MSNSTYVEAFEEDQDLAIDFLERNLAHIDNSDQLEFATSLVSYYRNRGLLSDKQKYYAAKFWSEAQQNSPETKSAGRVISAPEREKQLDKNPDTVVMRPNPDKMLALFATAHKNGLKAPKLVYKDKRWGKFTFFIFRKESKFAGSLGCNLTAKDFQQQDTYRNVFTFLLKPEKKLLWSWIALQDAEMQKYVASVMESPVEVAVKQGREQINCCFCGLDLTNKHSREVGYGPICAAKWGLPYGEAGEEGNKLADGIEI